MEGTPSSSLEGLVMTRWESFLMGAASAEGVPSTPSKDGLPQFFSCERFTVVSVEVTPAPVRVVLLRGFWMTWNVTR